MIQWLQKDVDWLLGDICNGDVLIVGGLLAIMVILEVGHILAKKGSYFF